MVNFLLTSLLKLFSRLIRGLGLGAGSTWPGHIMLTLNPSFLSEFDQRFAGKIIVIAGTNGKTTTSKMIRTILESHGKTVIHNESGANLLNGIASTLVLHSTVVGAWEKQGFATFEVDENTLPLLLQAITPDILIVLNLFRDQLDRYGEVNTVALKWKKALQTLPRKTTLILNANDPEIAFLGESFVSSRVKRGDLDEIASSTVSPRNDNTFGQPVVRYFGLSNPKLYLAKRPHAMDATNCPSCGGQLLFDGVYLGHLGNWQCSTCAFKEPGIDYSQQQQVLAGIYNMYNTQAAVLVAKTLKIPQKTITVGLKGFTPAFGRQEEFVVTLPRRHPERSEGSTRIKIFLSKNPTGFNESIRTIKELGAKHILLVLNDRIPDGRDVSWIWDIDTEEIFADFSRIIVSGDRCYDMGLRIKYSISSEFPISNFQFPMKIPKPKFQIEEDLKNAISFGVERTSKSDTLYILATYSAMLEVRKILGGRRLL